MQRDSISFLLYYIECLSVEFISAKPKYRLTILRSMLQVQLAQMEYQLPRLTRMWTHLERQAGGMVKGMGEKQIEVDKRILRTRVRSCI